MIVLPVNLALQHYLKLFVFSSKITRQYSRYDCMVVTLASELLVNLKVWRN